MYKLENPGRYACIGPSQSGKSELLIKLLRYGEVWKDPPKDVRYIAPTLADRQEYLMRLHDAVKGNGGSLTCEESLPKDDGGYNYNSFLIIDDVLSFPKKDIQRLKEIALRGSHHNKVTLIITQQVPYPQGEDFIAINKNLTGKFILYQTADIVGLQQISWRLFRKGNDFLLYCLYYAKDKLNTNYIFINNHPFTEIKRNNICYTKIFPDEKGPYFFDTENFDWKDLKVERREESPSVMRRPSYVEESENFLRDLIKHPPGLQKRKLKLLSHSKQVHLAKFLHNLNRKKNFSEETQKEILKPQLKKQKKLFKKNLSSVAKFKQTISKPLVLENTLLNIIPLIQLLYNDGRS
jgi:hypothetical protein